MNSAFLTTLFLYLPLACFAESPITTIGFGSCAHQNHDQPIWEQVNQLKPDVFIFVGDNIYGDTEDMTVLQDKYNKMGAKPGVKTLRENSQILATWDDHDYGKNDAGKEYPKKKESQQIFCDFWKVPADSPRRSREGIYDAMTFGPEGKRVQIILLDTRYFRDALNPLSKAQRIAGAPGRYQPSTNPKATILGEAQWTWLAEELKKPADIRLIASSIQVVAEDHGWEGWLNFPQERTRLYQLIREQKAQGVFFISGDRHHSVLSIDKTHPDRPYPMVDLTGSGLTQYQKSKNLEKNPHRVSDFVREQNFGWIAIDWDKRKLDLSIINREAKPVLQHAIPFAELSSE